jgi:hypothetical protein
MAVINDSPITDDIAKKATAILEEERLSAKARAEAELVAEREKKQEVLTEIDRRRQELTQMEKKIEHARELQNDLATNLEKGVAERVRKAIEDPIDLLASVAMIRAVGNSERAKAALFSNPGSSNEQSASTINATAECTSSIELQNAVQFALSQNDVSTDLFRPLHSSLVSGVMPIIHGARSYELLSAYAANVTGNQLCWIPVSASWLEPSDFLGRWDNAQGEFIAHSSGLLELITSARSDGRLRLVVFDGINRAPLDSYLLPLLACHADAGSTSPRNIPITVPNVGKISWPSNLLLAATFSPDEHLFPVTNSVWNYSSLIVTDALALTPEVQRFANRHPDARPSRTTSIGSTFIASETWGAWRQECQSRDLAPCASLWSRFAEDRYVSRTARDLALRYFAATRGITDEETSLGDTVAFCMLPQVVGDWDAVQTILATTKTPYGNGDLLRKVASVVYAGDRR